MEVNTLVALLHRVDGQNIGGATVRFRPRLPVDVVLPAIPQVVIEVPGENGALVGSDRRRKSVFVDSAIHCGRSGWPVSSRTRH